MKEMNFDHDTPLPQEEVQAKLDVMKSYIERIIDSLSRLEASRDHRFIQDFLIYFRRALIRLERCDASTLNGMAEVAQLMKQIAQVAASVLALLQQAKMLASVPRISAPHDITAFRSGKSSRG